MNHTIVTSSTYYINKHKVRGGIPYEKKAAVELCT